MKKIFCDACGIEINYKEERIYKFNPLVHITEDFPSYIDKDGNGISGREENYELCLKCYNRIYGAAWNKFVEIIKGK